MQDHRGLTRAVTLWRIGDPEGTYPIWNGAGAAAYAGRWNHPGQPVIHAATSYPLALLEVLAHWNGKMPVRQHYLSAEVPVATTYEVLQPADHPGWDGDDPSVPRAFGSDWLRSRRSALLFVPSVIAPMCQNVLVNPAHPDAARIDVGLETPVPWDRRLLRN